MSKYILKFRKSIGGVFLAAYVNKGKKLKQLKFNEPIPAHIAEFIGLQDNINKPQSELSFESIQNSAMVTHISIRKNYELRCTAEIDSPLANKRRMMKERRAAFAEAKKTPDEYIFNMSDLCAFFGADNPQGLNRRIYKDTDCGASISLYLINGKQYHNGENWNRLNFDSLLHSFTIQTIIENSDATVDSDAFVLPVKKADVDKWMEYMESEADYLWREANTDEFDGEDMDGLGFIDDAEENPRWEKL